MTQYIYFVKCPDCEDEHFDFFDEAKEFALGCLSKKPIITQIEVDQNDFGECTDSCDLGTVWSWEEALGNDVADAEDELTTFSKSETFGISDNNLNEKMSSEQIAELQKYLDDSMAAWDAKSPTEKGDDLKKAAMIKYKFLNQFTAGNNQEKTLITAGKKLMRAILDANVKTAAEYEDLDRQFKNYETELDKCLSIDDESYSDLDEELPLNIVDDDYDTTMIKQLVEDLEEHEDVVECKWCNELFDKDECRYEIDLGYLCPQCQAAIKSRGEELTFKEELSSKALTEAAFPYLARLEDAREQILAFIKDDPKISDFITDTTISVPYIFKFKQASTGQQYDGKIIDFTVLADGTIEFTVEHSNHRVSKNTLEDLQSKAPRNTSTYFFLKAVAEAAKQLDKLEKPDVRVRRDENILETLKASPEIANELCDHIVSIKYQIPLIDIYEVDVDANDEPLTDSALKKLSEINNNFNATGFAEKAIDAGLVENRSAATDTNHNIEKSWHAMGTITFNCPVEELSTETQTVIKQAKVKGTADDSTKRTVNCYRLAIALTKYFDNDVIFFKKGKSMTESFNSNEKVDFDYDELTATVSSSKRDVDDWDEAEYTDNYTFRVDKGDVATTIWENFLTEEDVKDVSGGFDTLEDNDEWQKFLDTHFNTLVDKYYDKLLDYYKSDAEEAFEEGATWNDYEHNKEAEQIDKAYLASRDEQFEESCKKSFLKEEDEDEDETPEVSDNAQLTTCPECGAEMFDLETGVCISCGFN